MSRDLGFGGLKEGGVFEVTTGGEGVGLDPREPDLTRAIAPSDQPEVLALVPDEESIEGRQAPWAVFRLAREWADGRRKVFVADLGVTRPSLHEAAAVPNHEGIVDVALYGASMKRVARRIPGSTLVVATSGTPVATGAPVYASEVWSELLSGLRSAGSHVLLLIPEQEEGMEAMLARADRVVRLSLEPSGDRKPAPAAKATRETRDPTRSPEAVREAVERAARVGTEGEEGAGGVASVEAEDLEASGGTRASRRLRLEVVAFVILLVVTLVLIAGVFGWINLPGITPFGE